jgi:general secretion pathway protein K
LGTLFVLSLLVNSFLNHVEAEVLYQDQQQPPADLELEWQSYGELTRAVLSEFKNWDKGLFSPKQGWGDPIAFASFPRRKDLEIRIEIQDETGKLPCLKSYESWHRAWIAQWVRDWSAERKVQESWKAMLEGQPVPMKKNPGGFGLEKEKVFLRTLEALRSVDAFSPVFFHEKGWGNETWGAFKAPLSPVSIGPINVNTAENLRELIAQKQGWDPKALADFFQRKDTFHMGNVAPFFRDQGDLRKHGFQLKDTALVGYQCQILQVAITLKRGDLEWMKSFWLKADDIPGESSLGMEADAL